MSAWTGKPCAECRGNKGPGYRDGKYCGKCTRGTVKRARRDTAHGTRILALYKLTQEDYWCLYELQGGHCAICPAVGKSKRLAVDHDHSCCKTTPTCGNCTRGLLCGSCNRIIGYLRDDAAAFLRAAEYLNDPPFGRLER